MRGRLVSVAVAAIGIGACSTEIEAAPTTRAEFQSRLDAIEAECDLAGKIELHALSATDWTASFKGRWNPYGLMGGPPRPAAPYWTCFQNRVQAIPGRKFHTGTMTPQDHREN
jgi:hypothetical protein